jgi:hypothetical protein
MFKEYRIPKIHHAYYKKNISWIRNKDLLRLCKVCGYAWGDHCGDECPGIDFNHTPYLLDPEFYSDIEKVNNNITIL